MNRRKYHLLILIFSIIFIGAGCVDRDAQDKKIPMPVVKKIDEPILVAALEEWVTYSSSRPDLEGLLCKPEGKGPFQAVVFHHGGKGDAVGGDPEETCRELAKAGYVGFSPFRREEISFDDNLDDARAAMEYVRTLAYVDEEELGLMGFSRGGLIAYLLAAERSDIGSLVVMASAMSRDPEGTSEDASKIDAPVLLMVAENDTPGELNSHQDLVVNMQNMHSDLLSAGVDSELIIYSPYPNHGHLMFFEIGDYWKDVIEFLDEEL